MFEANLSESLLLISIVIILSLFILPKHLVYSFQNEFFPVDCWTYQWGSK